MILTILSLVAFIAFMIMLCKPVSHSDVLSKEAIANIPSKFEELYREVCRENFVKLEEMRLKVKSISNRIITCTALTVIVIFYILWKNMMASDNSNVPPVPMAQDMKKFEAILIIIVMVFMAFVFAIVVLFNKKSYVYEYAVEYKDKVIKKFIKLFNSNLKYIPNTKDPKIYNRIYINYKKSAFGYWGTCQEFKAEDYIFGKIEDIFIEAADVNVTYAESDNKDDRKDMFSGFFCTVTLPIKTDYELRILRGGIVMEAEKGYKHIRMDNQEFEEKFNVYAKDEIATMMFLTHDIMEALLDFSRQCCFCFDIHIKNYKIYIKIYTGDMFEPSVYNESLNKEHLLVQYCTLTSIVNLSKLLNRIIKENESKNI